MKSLFDDVSQKCSTITTKSYSTSFTMGIKLLSGRFHSSIYSIYGFVRFADEIVDSFEGYKQEELLSEFKVQTYKAIKEKISLNPILNSFQIVVNKYNIEQELVEKFFNSMEMDLNTSNHIRNSYDEYILGSAEVVGLMCLRVFTENDDQLYKKLKPGAMKLGAAFQKVNFLRDLRSDHEDLGRTYFPDVDLDNFSNSDKVIIEKEIESDFDEALESIKLLPSSSRCGVYLAYKLYRNLFNKIKGRTADQVRSNRIRISNLKKAEIAFKSLLRHQINLIH
ncbi:MAG: phytoene/squalene synthase family protein [Bacteroidia bacterium]|nr:phytoene/squalene synthase family protein [Bacteroidia bacterium]